MFSLKKHPVILMRKKCLLHEKQPANPDPLTYIPLNSHFTALFTRPTASGLHRKIYIVIRLPPLKLLNLSEYPGINIEEQNSKLKTKSIVYLKKCHMITHNCHVTFELNTIDGVVSKLTKEGNT